MHRVPVFGNFSSGLGSRRNGDDARHWLAFLGEQGGFTATARAFHHRREMARGVRYSHGFLAHDWTLGLKFEIVNLAEKTER